MITILGLGPGDPQLLTREAWETLSQADEVYLRTGFHPTVAGLPPGVRVHTFDTVYERRARFADVYAEIVEQVMALGVRPEGVLYAVPGHPLVAERTVELILAAATERGLPVRIVAGLSFLEPTLELLGIDALPNLQLADGALEAQRHHPSIQPDAPALIAQVYNQAIASDVKLTLMNQYPDEHPVRLVHAAGTSAAQVEDLPLYAIDRSPHLAHLTSLFVPPLPQPSAFERFQETIAHLRAPEGCPWDREQTHLSLRKYLIEEAYEVLEALDAEDPEALRGELGDLLLQIVLHAQIATEAGEFTMADVIAEVQAKMIRRHPHVFGQVEVAGAGDVVRNWEQIKAEEKAAAGQAAPASVLGQVPAGLPALMQAETYQKRAAKVGFDWPDVTGVTAKIHEEIGEVERAPAEERAGELGDLLFAVVNWARWLKVDPELALRQANAKFAARFRHVERLVAEQGRDMKAMAIDELDAHWNTAKGL